MAAANTALMIGTFDGVHVGHAELAARARGLVGRGGRGGALAFDPHPMSLLKPGLEPERLTTLEQRRSYLQRLTVDEVVRLAPTIGLLSQTPEEFVRGLVDQYQPCFIVEGEDFRFGKGRAGD